MKHTVDLNFFPGWVRKSITFSIDDGNVRYDSIFLSYVKPAGILGTFNLCSNGLTRLPSAQAYRDFYLGYEIANHCKYHPYCFEDGATYDIAEEKYDEQKADEGRIYPTEVANLYQRHYPQGWRYVADTEGYCRFADDGRAELEAVFGKGKIGGFVWPFNEQNNAELIAHLKREGYYGIRKGVRGGLCDTEGFSLPKDPMRWIYTVNDTTLAEYAPIYEAYPDDGTLKMFCIGVHSVDFENSGSWGVLADFCARYGNRPETFWYATVGDIFAYDAAVKSVAVRDGSIENPSDIDLCILVDGKRVTLHRRSVYYFEK